MMTLTVTGGSLRGRKIKTVPARVTRYTPEKVRLALFSVIQTVTDIEECSFCDLCTGSGIMAIEAVSRGAKRCECVDVSHLSIATVIDNAKQLGIEDKMGIHCKNVLSFVKKTSIPHDIVFIDPPFQKEIAEKLINSFSTFPEIVKENGLLVIEYNGTVKDIEGFSKTGTYRYGTVFLNVYTRKIS
jgi:16S rRNA (guanine(966)-N(2))-methyltransferase RsmD